LLTVFKFILLLKRVLAMVVIRFDSCCQNMNVNSYRYGSQVILIGGLDLLASGAIPDTFFVVLYDVKRK
ncbi:hypothetical protein, partial [Lactobacillus sp. B4010]|uniref:hypothetical protein n=2 Tax=Lactobacillus TaxID=1578 RepID=UPI00226B8468